MLCLKYKQTSKQKQDKSTYSVLIFFLHIVLKVLFCFHVSYSMSKRLIYFKQFFSVMIASKNSRSFLKITQTFIIFIISSMARQLYFTLT